MRVPALIVSILVASSGCDLARSSDPAPRQRSDARFAADTECARCHPEVAAAWRGSHHDLAMQPATPDTVLGDFDDARFDDGTGTTRFFRRGERYFITTAGADGRIAQFDVSHVFGVEPLQQLLIPAPGGRLQAFPVAWDARPRAQGGQRWFHLTPDDAPVPGDPFHWTGVYQTWNHQCASCHSTAVERGYDAERDAYATTFSEIDVGCQACHGAGSEHVAWANGARTGAPAILRGNAATQLDACGPCHSRRVAIAPDPAPATPFHDSFLLAAATPPLYHRDGQIREEVYVAGSFLQSRMAQAGVTCTDCHDPHTARLRREGNTLCMTCHGGAAPTRFADLLGAGGAYDARSHHHHEPGSEAAQCVSCHMPSRLYMQIDSRRDHSFRIPRPDLARDHGAPDACTACHADQSPAWAARTISAWTDGAPPAAHFSEKLASADGRALAELAASPAQAAIVRASALDLLMRSPAWAGELHAGVTSSIAAADPLVRAYAARAAGALPVERRLELLPLLLADESRAVRSEAALGLADAPATALGLDVSRQRDRALGEVDENLRHARDTPAAHLQLGQLAERGGGDPDGHYHAALRLDPGLEPAAAHLARRLAAAGRPGRAEPILRTALRINPEAGSLHYDLGLLLAELGREQEALDSLERAAALAPGEPRVHYNLALLLERLGLRHRAEAAFLGALRLSPDDPALLYGLVAFYANQGRSAEALVPAERLARVRDDAETRALLEHLRAAAAGR